jgi:hypothetical protein
VSEEQKSLIFIPDISGFTRFVNDTEIQHSQHIIEELLEVILRSNDMKLMVSEIEGDAVLFYLPGDAPRPKDVSHQTKKMFINFHNYLHDIERDTICQCGACRTVSKLTLKFFIHYGELGVSQIRDHTKLMGKNVILAHRLMKNNLRSNEYLLMTGDYLKNIDEKSLKEHCNWSELKEGTEHYEHFGDITFKYIELSALHSEIKPLDKREDVDKFPDPIHVSLDIKAPLNSIYKIITDLSLRPKWSHGLKKITYNEDEIPRIGSKHICDLPSGLVEIETVQNNKSSAKIEYVERATKNFVFPQATTFFVLKKSNQGTNLSIEFHYKKRLLTGWLIDILFRKNIQQGIEKSANNLKNICEKSDKN